MHITYLLSFSIICVLSLFTMYIITDLKLMGNSFLYNEQLPYDTFILACIVISFHKISHQNLIFVSQFMLHAQPIITAFIKLLSYYWRNLHKKILFNQISPLSKLILKNRHIQKGICNHKEQNI